MARQTKAELTKMIEALNERISLQSSENAELRNDLRQYKEARKAMGILEPEEKEPETEVGYLRRQLAYTQGQLHQSHLILKELRRNGTRPGADTIQAPVSLVSEEDAKALRDLLSNTREILAMFANFNDLTAAGVKIPDRASNHKAPVSYLLQELRAKREASLREELSRVILEDPDIDKKLPSA